MNHTKQSAYRYYSTFVPLNREQRRSQIKRRGYYISLVGTETEWTCFGVRPNGETVAIANSGEYQDV